MNEPTRLYRWYDADGALLYVGISVNPATRARQHIQGSTWVDRAVRMEIDPTVYPSRIEALAAEAAAIRKEAPLCNIAGAHPRRRQPRMSLSLPSLAMPTDGPYGDLFARWFAAAEAKIQAIKSDPDADRAVREARQTAQDFRQFASEIGTEISRIAFRATKEHGWKAPDVAAALGVSRIRAYQIIAAGRAAQVATEDRD